MTDMVMSLASEFRRALDSRETLDLVVRSACAFYDGDWCGILNLQKDLDAWTPLHWYNAATGGMTDTEHFYEYEEITQYPQWKKAIEERTIICIRDLDQVASSYPMELQHYYRLQVRSVIAVPFYRGSTGFLVVRNPERYMDYPAFMMHVETVVLLSQRRPDTTIDVNLNISELEVSRAETKATYEEIKSYILEKHGLKETNLYIAQVKRKSGIVERENYNLPKTEGNRVPNFPQDKREAILDAFRHFKMI